MISVIVPCYNEAEVIEALHARLSAAAASWGEDYEVVAVDDGSQLPTWEQLACVAQRDPHWRIVRFSRNFGHQTAVSAGLFYCSGDCAIVIDADLQDPPEVLRQFIDQWRQGSEVVYAIRRQRKEGWFKRACYRIFYRVLGRMSRIAIPYDAGDFCLIDRKVIDLLNSMPEQNRFVRGLRAWSGFRQVGIEYERQARAGGKTHYSLIKLINLAIDGVFSFSTVPLRLVTYLGLVISLLSLLGACFTLLQRVFQPFFSRLGLAPVPGFATIVVSILFLGGIQLISIGVIGEYIGRIYDEVKRRPLWIVRQTLNLDIPGAAHHARCSSTPDPGLPDIRAQRDPHPPGPA